MVKKKTTTPCCPMCSGKLFYDGKGLQCRKCLYYWRPDKNIITPMDPPPAEGDEELEK